MEDLFYKRIKSYFPADYDRFIQKLKEEAQPTIFLNGHKASLEKIKSLIAFPIKDCPQVPLMAYYDHPNIGKTIAYDLGLIYPQELSAALPALIPDVKDVKLALDLCAAPGGKSINLLNRLNADAQLIANELSYNRAMILVSNLERLGFSNVTITNKKVEDLNFLEGQCDLIMLDAPCSGEGMARKYPAIIKDYHLNNIRKCAAIQKDLLDKAYALLKAGGQLVYSTCTYAPEEDEEQIATFLKDHPDTELKTFALLGKTYPGMAKFSLLDDMEGQFMAYMIKKAATSFKPLSYRKTLERSPFDAFLKADLSRDDYYLYARNDQFFLSFHKLIETYDHTLRCGICLGKADDKHLELSHHYYRSDLLNRLHRHTYDLNDEEYARYLNGEVLKVDLPDAYTAITYHDLPLGYGKAVKGELKNKYPKGLRRML